MNLHELVSQLIIDTKGPAGASIWSVAPGSSLGLFRPEIVICVTILLVLLVRMFRWGRPIHSAWITLVGAVIALCYVAPWQLVSRPEAFMRTEIFTGMLVYDGFGAFIRGVLLGFLILFVLLTLLSGTPRREDSADIFTLVLGATLGFCLMATANHLLMVFMAVEMASVPSYVLAGMLRQQRLGSEAALKYSVYGAGAAGIMLYGISLVGGLVNAVHLPTLAERLSEQVPMMGSGQLTVLALGCLMIMVGLAFKLSAVPFHFWCPDVFEGAPAEIGGFLSVASKAAALALLVRVTLGLSTLVPPVETSESVASFAPPTRVTQVAGADMFVVADRQAADGVALATPASLRPDTIQSKSADGLYGMRFFLAHLIGLLAAVTCTFGNLAAYAQTNIKRLLAYSTIAHAGYMMMAIPPMLAMAGEDPQGARYAVSGLAIYIVVYVFMNLGAFAIVALLRNKMQSEQIADYAGLLRRCPGIAISFSIILFSLVGLPPLSGFLGKFAIFAALAHGFEVTGQPYLIGLLVLGALNSTISLFYYLRIVKLMTMEPEPDTGKPFTLSMVSLHGAYICLLTLPTALLILFWEQVNVVTIAATRFLLPS